MSRPRIAVLMDENTSGGGTRYEAAKGYFHGLIAAGAAPFGLPYAPELTGDAVAGFDGLMTAGGRFAVPDDWYLGAVSPAPASARPAAERALVEGFLAAGKPILGLCAGMQALACLNGARMVADLKAWRPQAGEHDGREVSHRVDIAPGTRLFDLVGPTLEVNSFHREAIAQLASGVVASGHSPDGIVEAVELEGHPFALGLQWHQELLGPDHPGQAIFKGFVEACTVKNRTR
ncbi:MAG TPA: gamma-glutamyl-gamma-aminobutyrate hydrolase family protein [Phenylobacterium sp.]|nr:gamma-glutamyl-gamma-aminobutyrate hydrolase family protein [Phenylobacterium sp.]